MNNNPIWKLVRNIFSVLAIRAGDVIYAFLSLAVLARYFGPSLYGDYVFIVSFVFIFIPYINFGLHPIMVRELAVKKKERVVYYGSGLAFRLLLAVTAAVIILVSLPSLGLNDTQKTALLICFLAELSLLGCRILDEVFITFERIEIDSFIFLSNRTVSIIMLLGISHFDLGFLAVFAVFGVINVLTLLISATIINWSFLPIRFAWRSELLLFWLKAGWAMAISMALMEYFLRVDVYILRIFRDPAEIAYFEAVYKIIAKLYMISSAFAIALSPAFARLAEAGYQRLRPLIEQSLKVLLIIVIPLGAGAIILGPHLVVPFLGEKFAPSEKAMSLLSWCLFFSFFEPLLTGVLIAIRKVWVVPVIHFIAISINLVFDLLWVPEFGYIGACYANIVAYATLFLVSIGVTYYSIGGFSLKRAVGRVAAVGLLTACCLYLYKSLEFWIPMSPVLFFTLGTIISFSVYMLLLWLARALTWDDLVSFKETVGQEE